MLVMPRAAAVSASERIRFLTSAAPGSASIELSQVTIDMRGEIGLNLEHRVALHMERKISPANGDTPLRFPFPRDGAHPDPSVSSDLRTPVPAEC